MTEARNCMEHRASARFDFARPTTAVTKAIVIRGKGRFAILRPEAKLPSVIASNVVDGEESAIPVFRLGGVPRDARPDLEFEAGMQFGASA
jgi:hypothetical protein